jgi:dihydroflavonol-4-reductase
MTDSTPSEVSTTPHRVFLTGATGFLGHHVAERLVADGHTVTALVRNPESAAARRLPAEITIVRGDLLDAEAVTSAMREAAIDRVIHCAGMVSREPEDATRMHEVNVTGTEIVLAAAKAAGAPRVVHASTSGTIGISTDEDYVATEDDPAPIELINRWPYYRTKLYAERAALAQASDELEVVCVNPSLLLGPGDLHGSSTEDVRRYLEQRVPISPAGGMSFVDARDAAAALVLALDAGRSGQRYLVTACNCTVRTFFGRVARVAGMQPPQFSLPSHQTAKKLSLALVRAAHKWLGEDESVPDPTSVDMSQHYWYVDASKAERELGWTSRDGMDTLADTVADLRARGIVMMAPPD